MRRTPTCCRATAISRPRSLSDEFVPKICGSRVSKSRPGAPKSGTRSSRQSLVIQVFVLVILRALKRELEGEAILCDLINVDLGGYFHRPGVCSALFACLGCRIGLS